MGQARVPLYVTNTPWTGARWEISNLDVARGCSGSVSTAFSGSFADLVDGSDSTNWNTGNVGAPDGAYATFDLGREEWVGAIRVWCPSDLGLMRYELLSSSDNSTWTSRGNYRHDGPGTAYQESFKILALPIRARYWRWRIQWVTGGLGRVIGTISLYRAIARFPGQFNGVPLRADPEVPGSGVGVGTWPRTKSGGGEKLGVIDYRNVSSRRDATQIVPITASRATAMAAIDDNETTEWDGNVTTPGWLVVDLGRSVRMVQSRVRQRPHAEASQNYAHIYAVQHGPSTNGPWTSAALISAGDADADADQTFACPGNHRYWRFLQVSSNTWAPLIVAWELWGYG